MWNHLLFNTVKRMIPLMCGSLIVLVVFMVVLITAFTLTKFKKRIHRQRNVPIQSSPSDPIYDEVASKVILEHKPSQSTHDENDIIMLSPNECYQAVRRSSTLQLAMDKNVAYHTIIRTQPVQ